MNELKSKLLSYGVFNDDTWLDHYCELIHSNIHTAAQKGVTNSHHIVPRSLFLFLNKDIDASSCNRVNLIYSDHLLAHYYLMKSSSVADVRFQNACGMMFSYLNTHGYCLDAEWLIQHADELNEAYTLACEYREMCRKDWWETCPTEERQRIAESIRDAVKKLKTIHCGSTELRVPPNMVKGYLNKGYKLGRSDRSKDSISVAKMGSIPWNKDKTGLIVVSEYTRSILSKKAMGHNVTEDMKKNIGLKNKGKIYVSKDSTVIKIHPEQLTEFLSNGWIRGSIKNKGMTGRVIVNNGQTSISIREEELDSYLSQGWVRGRHDVSPIRGRVSPTAGKIWITNGHERRVVSMKVFNAEYARNGWIKGRFIDK